MIPVHRAVLHAASVVFARMLQTPMQESIRNVITMPNTEYYVVLELVRYIYTGTVENLDTMAMNLLDLAEKYGIFPLKQKCVNLISKNLSLSNVLKSLIAADRYREPILFKNCVKFIQL